MTFKYKITIILVVLTCVFACQKEDYDIGYQDGYPNMFADNWIVFEFQGGDLEGDILEPYQMVTSLDPNHEGALILDKLYNADIRVRARYTDSSFYVTMGEQLESISDNNYGIHYVSLDGYITTNPVLTNLAYNAANMFYENAAISESDIEDILFMRAGFYDSLKIIVDTILVVGYRKTGHEDVDYQP